MILLRLYTYKVIRDFPGDPVAKTTCARCRRPRFDPWLGTRSHTMQLRVCMPQLKVLGRSGGKHTIRAYRIEIQCCAREKYDKMLLSMWSNNQNSYFATDASLLFLKDCKHSLTSEFLQLHEKFFIQLPTHFMSFRSLLK